ncbi:MAG: DUF2189 domain-containing protein [Halioglobus sp.]|nr:DUF2189 domain-containing protein [Halioglobus sp.]
MPENGDTFSREQMPFVAPCRTLAPFAAFGWLRRGADDWRRAPWQSLAYGGVMTVIIALVTLLALTYGSVWLMLSVLGGFIFLAPLACVGLYAISAQLERNQPPQLAASLRTAFRRHLGNELVFAIVLLVIFLVWARAGAIVSVFFPEAGHPGARELAGYLAIGSAVGALFAAVTFAASAFSLPMIMHRDVDTVTAVVTSVNAVLRNKLPLLIWMALVVAELLIGMATAFVGLLVILPLIGYAAWHGYLETIDASAFPRHLEGITAVPRCRDD